ncbi:VIT-domain-containing protein [Aspergillus sclerotioniger CBS 115572]|uniref:VIT-domain-containing protein n=1 Tax=Aspergillus sclerotioniger CBS 115572 TaxID=1450535 RepID=A0A317XGN4_9EURO|nr:VIT-domain-containing protein [Aspergillus sclerotioniger CBS 115572]PWY96498.1 VIT-domain-containing protein [Aspergillus sclerotioniger CBS 115572]
MDAIDRFQSGLFVQSLQPQKQPLPNQGPEHGNLKEVPLPLLGVSVDVDIQGRFSTTKITQCFTNASSSAARDAHYLFPLYDGSVITSFRCWLGDRLLEGSVKPREVAQENYKEAVSQHKAAVLIGEATPEIFELNVGNIPAKTTVRVEIVYTNVLKLDNSTGGLVLTIPTSVAPRYGHSPVTYYHSDGTNRTLSTDGLKINIQALFPAPIRRMESRTHPISVELGAVTHQSFQEFAKSSTSNEYNLCSARASLADRSAAMDRDFVVLILSVSPELTRSQAIAEAQPDSPHHTTVAVTLIPGTMFMDDLSPTDSAAEIIFITDQSGSMDSKVSALRDVMDTFLRSLPQNCSFNLCSFGSSYSWLWPVSKDYSQDTLDSALQHIESFGADMGGTEILETLKSVLDHTDTGKHVPTNVILLTDGEVWNVDEVVKFVRTTSLLPDRNIRFFSLGIGDRGIGIQGGGYAGVVAQSLGNNWQGRVIQMLKAALVPSRLRCEVDLGPQFTGRIPGSDQHNQDRRIPYVRAPYHIPPLSIFAQFSVYFMIETNVTHLPEMITVSATTDEGKRFSRQLPLQHCLGMTGKHHLAARALMNDYESCQSWLHLANVNSIPNAAHAVEAMVKQEAQQLGQHWSLISKWTSYVAIERKGAEMQQIFIRRAGIMEASDLVRPRPRVWASRPLRHMLPPAWARDSYRPRCQARLGTGPNRSIKNPNVSQRVSHRSDPSYAPPIPAKLESEEIDRPETHCEGMPSPIDILTNETVSVQLKSNCLFHILLRGQKADGRHLHAWFFGIVVQDLMDNLPSSSQPKSFQEREKRPIALMQDVLAIVYITEHHSSEKNLWELQIEKARRWLIKVLAELIALERPVPADEDSGDLATEDLLAKLENLARSQLREMPVYR